MKSANRLLHTELCTLLQRMGCCRPRTRLEAFPRSGCTSNTPSSFAQYLGWEETAAESKSSRSGSGNRGWLGGTSAKDPLCADLTVDTVK